MLIFQILYTPLRSPFGIQERKSDTFGIMSVGPWYIYNYHTYKQFNIYLQQFLVIILFP